MRVLLVDDDEALLTIYSTSLRTHGYEVITASNGKAGIEKTKTQNPDLVLLDQVLPDIQGNEVLKTLKEDPQTKNVPVAMLSNFGQNELIQTALNYGAVDYILKYQIEPDYLDTKIKEIVKSQQAETNPGQSF
jgi:DNA-binding response OmpR family regulator